MCTSREAETLHRYRQLTFGIGILNHRLCGAKTELGWVVYGPSRAWSAAYLKLKVLRWEPHLFLRTMMMSGREDVRLLDSYDMALKRLVKVEKHLSFCTSTKEPWVYPSHYINFVDNFDIPKEAIDVAQAKHIDQQAGFKICNLTSNCLDVVVALNGIIVSKSSSF